MNRLDSLAQIIEIEENKSKLENLYDEKEQQRKQKLRNMIIKVLLSQIQK